ncbi:MFS general substrate transporter [Leucosporidium creatinivorum]|uniref:MFS general substrate transporter n=1 Tax=Leucosporidium creatinivorum TaxID=106004 RepID=A0A1Y2D7B1_9BASI|nr:MFS general substrate transporter [Leucosporidium creatinivorum]
MAEFIQQRGVELSTISPSPVTTQPPSRDESPASSVRRLKDQRAEAEASELPPADRGLQAWTFALNAWFLETMIWGWSFSFGELNLYLATHAPFNKSSLASIGAVGTVALAIQYMLPLALISVFRRYPDWARTMLWAATFTSCGSMLISSWASKIWQLILLQGVLCGISGAVLYTPVLIWLQEWWVVRRGMASGLIFSGTGVGGFVFPFLLNSLLEKVGFAWTCRVWALITFVIFGGCVATLRPRLPAVKPAVRGPWVTRGTNFSFAWHPTVILMYFITFLSSLSFFPVAVYLSTYVDSLASSLSATTVLAVFNAASVVGQVYVGYLSDQYDKAWIIAGLGIGSALTAFLAWGFGDTLAKVFGFCILYGIFSSICSTWNAAARDVAGGDLRISTTVFSLFGIFRGIASIVGPMIAASLYDEKHRDQDDGVWGRYGFRGIMIFVGSMALASAACGFGLRATKHIKTQ